MSGFPADCQKIDRFFLAGRSASPQANFGRASARRAGEGEPSLTFAGLAGHCVRATQAGADDARVSPFRFPPLRKNDDATETH